MQRIPLEIVDRSLPGRAPVSEHSIFSAVMTDVRANAEEVAPPSAPPAATLVQSVSLGSMVALPEGAPTEAPVGDVTALVTGTLEGRLAPESARQIGEVRLDLPLEPLTGGLFELEWGAGERNHYYLFLADPEWFCGPGAFIVGPGALSPLDQG